MVPSRYTIIPDIHGRPFWRDAVLDVETTPVVFMGDYLDPYPQDGVMWNEAWREFKDIVNLKKRYPGHVTLLLGNHDVHYLPGYPFFNIGSRYSQQYADRVRRFILQNLPLFDMATVIPRSDGKPFVLTHAGVLKQWVGHLVRSVHPDIPEAYAFVEAIIGSDGNPVALARLLNDTLHTDNEALLKFFITTLGCVPGSRGGRDTGSCIWADFGDLEFASDLLPNCIHIVGHTRQDSFVWLRHEPKRKTNAYCVDYGRAFTLEPGSSPFLRFKNELKSSFSCSDLMAAPEYFIFGKWLWNLSDKAREEADAVFAEALSDGRIREWANGQYYLYSYGMRLLHKDGEPDLPAWVVGEWDRIKPQLDGMKPEDLSGVICGRERTDRYHKPRW